MTKQADAPLYPASDPLMKLSVALKWLRNNAAIDPPLSRRQILLAIDKEKLAATQIGTYYYVKKSSLIKYVTEIQEGVH